MPQALGPRQGWASKATEVSAAATTNAHCAGAGAQARSRQASAQAAAAGAREEELLALHKDVGSMQALLEQHTVRCGLPGAAPRLHCAAAPVQFVAAVRNACCTPVRAGQWWDAPTTFPPQAATQGLGSEVRLSTATSDFDLISHNNW